MKIEINEQKILTEVLERDGSLHQKIKETIEKRLIDDIVNVIERKYMKNSWGRQVDEIMDSVLETIREKQEEMAKKILKEFYESYRYGKKDVMVLKKLKEFLGEE